MKDMVGLFRTLSMGVYVIGVTDGVRCDAFTAASVAHVSYQPLLVSLAINPQHASYPLLCAGRAWTISVLRRDQIELARRFGSSARASSDKMSTIRWVTARSGAPYLERASAYFDCQLAAEFPAGDHRIVLGRVTDGAVLSSAAAPLLYADTGDLDHSSVLYPLGF